MLASGGSGSNGIVNSDNNTTDPGSKPSYTSTPAQIPEIDYDHGTGTIYKKQHTALATSASLTKPTLR